MENGNQKIVVFEETMDKKVSSIIAQILKNNGLEETFDDYFKKNDAGEEPWADIIYDSTKDIASKNITDEEFISLAEDKLKITKITAKNVLKEIEEKLIPIAKIIVEENMENTSETPATAKNVKNHRVADVPPKSFRPEKLPIEQSAPPQKANKNDTYREQIE